MYGLLKNILQRSTNISVLLYYPLAKSDDNVPCILICDLIHEDETLSVGASICVQLNIPPQYYRLLKLD